MPEETKINIVDLLDMKRFGDVKRELSELNSVDIAELLNDVSHENTIRLFRLLDKDVAADVFAYMDTDSQQQLIEAMTDKEIRDVLNDMFLDDTVDLLGEMPASIVSRLLRICPADMRGPINQYLN